MNYRIVELNPRISYLDSTRCFHMAFLMRRIPARSSPFSGRGVSTATRISSLTEQLHQKLTSRHIPFIYDYLHPQPSHLLNLTLSDFLPKTWSSLGENSPPTTLPSIDCPPRLAVGHHLVYFPPQVTLSQLLPDGTDLLHSPGEPFNRRLWAGGRVRFPQIGDPLLDGSRAVCIETIRNVAVRGQQGEEKIFVAIERRIGRVQEGEEESGIRNRIWKEDEEHIGQASVIENRNLVFMREKTWEQVNYDKERFENNSRTVERACNRPMGIEIPLTLSIFY